MSTDVEVRTDQPAAVEPAPQATPVQLAPTTAIATLAQWAAEARAANLLAQSLCATSFVPKHFYNKPAEATAAILTGHELGLSPLASLRAIFVFNGTPGMYAKAMVGVVQSQGHEVWIEEQSDEKVIVCGRRKGSEHVYRTTWDRNRVVRAKLTGNSKYQETPQQMMTARGQAEICRQVAPDALYGIPYAVEELRDMRSDDADVPAAEDGRITSAEILGELVDDAPVDGAE